MTPRCGGAEPESVLRTALADERSTGLDVTIFNPRLDPVGGIAARLTECLRRGLSALTGEGDREPRQPRV